MLSLLCSIPPSWFMVNLLELLSLKLFLLPTTTTTTILTEYMTSSAAGPSRLPYDGLNDLLPIPAAQSGVATSTVARGIHTHENSNGSTTQESSNKPTTNGHNGHVDEDMSDDDDDDDDSDSQTGQLHQTKTIYHTSDAIVNRAMRGATGAAPTSADSSSCA
jgi:hypothetical protein